MARSKCIEFQNGMLRNADRNEDSGYGILLSNLIWVKTFGMILKNYTKSTLVTFTEYRHLKSIDLIGKNTDNVMLSLIKTTWTKKVFFFVFVKSDIQMVYS